MYFKNSVSNFVLNFREIARIINYPWKISLENLPNAIFFVSGVEPIRTDLEHPRINYLKTFPKKQEISPFVLFLSWSFKLHAIYTQVTK